MGLPCLDVQVENVRGSTHVPKFAKFTPPVFAGFHADIVLNSTHFQNSTIIYSMLYVRQKVRVALQWSSSAAQTANANNEEMMMGGTAAFAFIMHCSSSE